MSAPPPTGNPGSALALTVNRHLDKLLLSQWISSPSGKLIHYGQKALIPEGHFVTIRDNVMLTAQMEWTLDEWMVPLGVADRCAH